MRPSHGIDKMNIGGKSKVVCYNPLAGLMVCQLRSLPKHDTTRMAGRHHLDKKRAPHNNILETYFMGGL